MVFTPLSRCGCATHSCGLWVFERQTRERACSHDNLDTREIVIGHNHTAPPNDDHRRADNASTHRATNYRHPHNGCGGHSRAPVVTERQLHHL